MRAFAPNLPHSQYYHYLVSGATRPRRETVNLNTYVPAPATNSSGFSVPILDAYGSLAQIANERPGTPLCGVTAELRSSVPQNPGALNQLIVNRGDGASPDAALQLQPNELFGDFSIAQGGRRLSAWVTDANFDDVLREYVLTNGMWALNSTAPLNNRQRFYLESDTLYVPFFSAPVLERRGADGSVARLDLTTSGAFTGFTGNVRVTTTSPSPDGRWVFIQAVGPAACAGGDDRARTMLVSMKPAAGPPVVLRELCADTEPLGPNRAAWSSDGKVLFGFGGSGHTTWRSTTAQGGWVEGATVATGAQVLETAGTPDDVGNYTIELVGTTCRRALRSQVNAQNFVTLASGTTRCPSFPIPFMRAPHGTPESARTIFILPQRGIVMRSN
jgi:hypothetical protein